MCDLDFTQILQMIDGVEDMKGFKYIFSYIKKIYHLHNIAYYAFDLSYAPDSESIVIATYAQEWVKRYIKKSYINIDPIIDAGRRGFLPIDWSTIDRNTPTTSLFFKEADFYDVGRQGMTFPVCKLSGGRALFSVTSNAAAKDWDRTRSAHMGEFQLIAHYVHDKASRLSSLHESNRLGRPLSNRERQCLQAVSHGLTAKQIAADLDISNTAVHLYLSNAKKKLACDNVPQAAICAVHLGLISNTVVAPDRTFNII